MNSTVVLSIDDRDDDNVLLHQACRKSLATFKLQIVTDGQTGIDYLSGVRGYEDRQRFPLPHLLLLDLKMPRKSGFEVLEWLRNESPFRELPVAVFSSSQDEADLEQAYLKGATWFLMKPVNFEDLIHLVSAINEWEITRSLSALTKAAFYRGPLDKSKRLA